MQTFWLVFMMMETGLFSILLLLVQAWDAVNDPMIGSIIDNDKRRYKRGKYKQYIFIGACGLLIGGAILCIFPLCPKNLQLIVYMVGLVFFGLGMGFYNCVSWAMMGDAIDYQEWKFGKREESVVYAQIGRASCRERV